MRHRIVYFTAPLLAAGLALASSPFTLQANAGSGTGANYKTVGTTYELCRTKGGDYSSIGAGDPVKLKSSCSNSRLDALVTGSTLTCIGASKTSDPVNADLCNGSSSAELQPDLQTWLLK